MQTNVFLGKIQETLQKQLFNLVKQRFSDKTQRFPKQNIGNIAKVVVLLSKTIVFVSNVSYVSYVSYSPEEI